MRQPRFLLASLMVAALAACGGGSDSTTGAGSTTPPPTGGNPGSNALSISGTAATGLAIANAQVEAKCASGNASGTTGADGSFTLNFQSTAAAPCVLQVTLPGGGTLHSVVAAGTNGQATANITPLTELLTAAVSGGDAAALFAAFDAVAQGKLEGAAIDAAGASVIQALSGVVDLSGIDLLKSALVAATSSGGTGNALDQKLDLLKAKLEEMNVKLDEVATALATSPNSAAPLQSLLQPVAATCATFRSGNYHSITLHNGEIESIAVDAPTLKLTYKSDASTETLSAGADACTFSVAGDEPKTLWVSPASAGVVRQQFASGPARAELLLPAQDLPLSELAGTWNFMAFEQGDAGLEHGGVTITFDADGKVTGGADCQGTVCEDWGNVQMAATRNAAGGFDLTDEDGTARAFLVKNASGKRSMVIAHAEGFLAGAPAQSETLPAVGRVSRFWDATLAPDGAALPISVGQSTVTTVDAATRIVTRTGRVADGADQPNDSWTWDVPRTGMRYRAAASGVAEVTSVTQPALGWGATAVTLGNGQHRYLFSVQRPAQ